MTITRDDLDLDHVDFLDLELTGKRIEPVLPGQILRDVLGRRGALPSALASAMDVPVNRVTAIIRGERAITADTAIRLGVALDTSADLWLGLQDAYELAIARTKVAHANLRPMAASMA